MIDVDALALLNAYASSRGAGRDAVLLVHAGASMVTTAVVRAGRLARTRDASLARDVHSDGDEELAPDDAAFDEGDVESPDAAEREAAADVAALEIRRAVAEGGAGDDDAEPFGRIVASGGVGLCARIRGRARGPGRGAGRALRSLAGGWS